MTHHVRCAAARELRVVALVRDVLALGHHGDLPAVEKCLTQTLGAHDALGGLKLNVSEAPGCATGMICGDGDALDLSALFEVLFQLLRGGLEVHVLHEHAATVRVCATAHTLIIHRWGDVVMCAGVQGLLRLLLIVGVVDLVFKSLLLLLCGFQLSLQAVEALALLDHPLQVIIQGHVQGLYR